MPQASRPGGSGFRTPMVSTGLRKPEMNSGPSYSDILIRKASGLKA